MFCMQNTEHRDTKKAWRFELLSVICKSGPLKWTQALLCPYTDKKRSRMGSVVSAAGWPELGEGSAFTQGDGHVCSLPTKQSFLRYFFFSKSGRTQETGFLILVLVNIFMRSFWENSTDSKSLINKREQGMLKLSHDHGYQMGAGGQWRNTFTCCLFISISINLQAQTPTSA